MPATQQRRNIGAGGFVRRVRVTSSALDNPHPPAGIVGAMQRPAITATTITGTRHGAVVVRD